MKTYKLTQVLAEENELIKQRREIKFDKKTAEKLEDEKFGIALSGGGIRSATINLGFLKTLNHFDILKKADYISTVSGGGYTGAYVQATVQQEGYDSLFHEKKIKRLQEYGDYMIPGQSKLQKYWNAILLTFGYLVSWAMSLFSPLVTVLIGYLVIKSMTSLANFEIEHSVLDWNYENNQVMHYLSPALWTLGAIVLIHLVLNLTMNFSLSISKYFTHAESYVILTILAFLVIVGIVTLDTSSDWTDQQVLLALLSAAGLGIIGFILNPNSLSFHRYYRKQLADAFLGKTSPFRNMLLKDVFKIKAHIAQKEGSEKSEYLPPYPLINTCLNLQNPGADEKFKGAKASDFFLLSPMFCGSKLSSYVKTAEFPGYKHLTLPASLTISAAAVNPGMGVYSNKMLSITMTLLNARLGFWVNNPESKKPKLLPEWTSYIVWWPSYFFKELRSKIGTKNRKLNISDGGHIENLAVYELLRRKCRLILAFDAGADPTSSFADLENLSIRARNELGIDIAFRPGQDPVDIIRPKATSGYAQKRFAVADLMKIWEEFEMPDKEGKPITFKRKIIQEGEIKERDCKEEKLEVIVNYFYTEKNKNILQFWVDLKAARGLDFTKTRYDELKKEAELIVEKKLLDMKNKVGSDKIKIGTLVYIKSSVTPPRKLFVPMETPDGEKNFQFDSLKYKIYHPDFPHESTADQFFDPVQWESYFQLGQSIGTEVLGVSINPDEYSREKYNISIGQMIRLFDDGEKPLTAAPDSFHLIDVSHIEPQPEKPLPKTAKPLDKQPEPSSEPDAYDPELKTVSKEQIQEEIRFKI